MALSRIFLHVQIAKRYSVLASSDNPHAQGGPHAVLEWDIKGHSRDITQPD